MDRTERIVTLTVAPRNEIGARMDAALAGRRTAPRIAFASVDLLHRVCAPKRLAILRAMAGAGPLPVREVARRVGRDVKAVHRDMAALVGAGLLDRDEGGRMNFPYDGVRMEVDLMRAA